MPASPNDPRTKRRKAMGDDPNKIAYSPQPVPGAPQGAGNQMNYPMQMNLRWVRLANRLVVVLINFLMVI